MSEEKKIIIDEDWKSQVEAEREAAKAASEQPQSGEAAADQPAGSASDADPPMPPASFTMLISTLATEAMMALGQMPHPLTGEVTPRRNQAKYLIDTIDMLHEKTKGNVSAEETAGVEELLHTLKMAFVQMPQSASSAQE
ncbi:DUF1844 domain-containing protein [Aeoliella sp.]|uniref:DUF1844 domain-containing protein n=1 Tax=Aeoliella sp. TaxID=2795800 RepID=UPI003CCB9CA9